MDNVSVKQEDNSTMETRESVEYANIKQDADVEHNIDAVYFHIKNETASGESDDVNDMNVIENSHEKHSPSCEETLHLQLDKSDGFSDAQHKRYLRVDKFNRADYLEDRGNAYS